jgi:hypothetical protein
VVRRAGEAAQFAKQRNPTKQRNNQPNSPRRCAFQQPATRKINTRQPSNINASRLLITRG